MHESPFFEGIRQLPFEENGHRFCTPTFYYDVTTVNTAFLTPVKHVRQHLPSPQMKPIRVTPWHTLTIITAFEYRSCDIGSYNEVSIGFPITIGRSAPVLIGALNAVRNPTIYVWHLPVTTEIARYGGFEFFGFPKFLAEITFERENGWIQCELLADDQHILTLRAKELQTKPTSPSEHERINAVTTQGNRILRSEVIINPRQEGTSRSAGHVEIELGGHAIAQQLRKLEMGRLMQLQYMPQNEAILTNALESYAM